MRLLVTRPREDAQSLAQALVARGIEPMIEPMINIIDLPGPPVARHDAQAILFTSANGVRALQRRNQGDLSQLLPLPVLAVGDATAQAARDAGFRRVESAAGDVAALVSLTVARLAPDAGPLLHIAGSEVAGDLAGRLTAAGFAMRREAIYGTRQARQLSMATLDGLRLSQIDAVTFFSPRTAAAFVTLCRDTGASPLLQAVVALCLSPAVAQAVSAITWRAIVVAPRPDQDALLGCLDDPALRPSTRGGPGSSSSAYRRQGR